MIKINKVDRLEDNELHYEHLNMGQFFTFGYSGSGLRLKTNEGHLDLSDGNTFVGENYLTRRVKLVGVEIKWAYK